MVGGGVNRALKRTFPIAQAVRFGSLKKLKDDVDKLLSYLHSETRSTTIMISNAVKSMLKEVDYNGSLIPVSSLNDSSGKLNLLSLIVKTRPRLGCFWQEPKYQSRGFTLSDVLKPGKLEEPKDKPFNP
ncbi:unnamed protein product, partial [Coregonus sp. 'balchen']